MRPVNCALTPFAVEGLVCPDMFAEVTASGPVRRSSSRVTFRFGIRTPTVFNGETTSGIVGWRGTTMVSGPGQNFFPSLTA